MICTILWTEGPAPKEQRVETMLGQGSGPEGTEQGPAEHILQLSQDITGPIRGRIEYLTVYLSPAKARSIEKYSKLRYSRSLAHGAGLITAQGFEK